MKSDHEIIALATGLNKAVVGKTDTCIMLSMAQRNSVIKLTDSITPSILETHIIIKKNVLNVQYDNSFLEIQSIFPQSSYNFPGNPN